MKNISFGLTIEQVRNRTKTVTRRLGWLQVRPGDLLSGVEKAMGLKAGEKVVRLAIIRVTGVRREALAAMMHNVEYGVAECVKEGFGDHPTLSSPDAFVAYFCNSHQGCTPETLVTRIEFEYQER